MIFCENRGKFSSFPKTNSSPPSHRFRIRQCSRGPARDDSALACRLAATCLELALTHQCLKTDRILHYNGWTMDWAKSTEVSAFHCFEGPIGGDAGNSTAARQSCL